jgi:hypothetical protein
VREHEKLHGPIVLVATKDKAPTKALPASYPGHNHEECRKNGYCFNCDSFSVQGTPMAKLLSKEDQSYLCEPHKAPDCPFDIRDKERSPPRPSDYTHVGFLIDKRPSGSSTALVTQSTPPAQVAPHAFGSPSRFIPIGAHYDADGSDEFVAMVAVAAPPNGPRDPSPRWEGQQPAYRPRTPAERSLGPSHRSNSEGDGPTPPTDGLTHMAAMQAAVLRKEIADMPSSEQKDKLGDHLFKLIAELPETGERTGKITGMILERETSDLFHLIASPEALRGTVALAIAALNQHSMIPPPRAMPDHTPDDLPQQGSGDSPELLAPLICLVSTLDNEHPPQAPSAALEDDPYEDDDSMAASILSSPYFATPANQGTTAYANETNELTWDEDFQLGATAHQLYTPNTATPAVPCPAASEERRGRSDMSPAL